MGSLGTAQCTLTGRSSSWTRRGSYGSSGSSAPPGATPSCRARRSSRRSARSRANRRDRFVAPGAREALAGLAASLALLVTPAAGQPAGVLQALRLVGYPAETRPPGFRATTADGRRVSLEELRGRVVFLNFWATWCLECRQELPMLEQLHRAYAPRGLMVLGVNFQETPKTVQQYAREQDLSMVMLIDRPGVITRSYGVIGLPTSFLIGRDGRAVARAIGPREWIAAELSRLIDSLLGEPIPR